LIAGTVNFLEDLIDACVMECDDCEHLASRKLLGFHSNLEPHLAAYLSDGGPVTLTEFISRIAGEKLTITHK
jgi:hypothetical protein